MKKLMTMACAIIMAAAANASRVTTVAFSEARVNVPARVRFVKGDDYGFKVEAKDPVVAKSMRCSVKDGVLRIGFGNSLQPGTSTFDAKKNIYYYGINASGQVLSDDNMVDEIVITVVAPETPVFKTSADYVAVTVKTVEETQKTTGTLTMNE